MSNLHSGECLHPCTGLQCHTEQCVIAAPCLRLPVDLRQPLRYLMHGECSGSLLVVDLAAGKRVDGIIATIEQHAPGIIIQAADDRQPVVKGGGSNGIGEVRGRCASLGPLLDNQQQADVARIIRQVAQEVIAMFLEGIT
jgi:hypothetical protein